MPDTDGTQKKADPLGRDAFLNLLITQLQHQDPTQPQADGEFLAQLAQFSALEQLQHMNERLDQIAALVGVPTTESTTADAASSSGSTASL